MVVGVFAGRTDATRGIVGNREGIVHTYTEIEVTTAGDKRFYAADGDGGDGDIGIGY